MSHDDAENPSERAARRTTEAAAGLAHILWIGGAQWAGKSSVAQILAARHGLIHYAYDYHDARSHADRARAHPDRYPHHHALLAALARNPDDIWVTPTPEEMAASAQRSFVERFEMVLDDLRALPSDRPVLAEGWGLRPRMIAPLAVAPQRAVFLVPTEKFRAHQLQLLPRAARLAIPSVSDPDRAQRNCIERDRLLAQDVIHTARRLGLPVVMVDGAGGVDQLVSLVEAQFRPYLPAWLY